jgi:hypothetical protein
MSTIGVPCIPLSKINQEQIMKNKKQPSRSNSKYPSGRPGGAENVWNFSKSYESSATIPKMRGKLKKFVGKNIHK